MVQNNIDIGKRTLVIGDIHGDYDKLLRVLDYAGYSGREKLIFLGDYISDKNKNKSYNVLDFLLELKKDKPDTIFLRGNHEAEILSKAAYFTNTCGINPWFFEQQCSEGLYFYFDNQELKCARSDLVMNTLEFYLEKEYLKSSFHAHSLTRIESRLKRVTDKNKQERLRNLMKLEYRKIYDMFIKRFIDDNKKSFGKVIRFPRKYIEFLKQTRLRYENDNFFFSHYGNPPGNLYDYKEEIYYDMIISENSVERKDFDKIIVCGHWHSDFIKFKKICLALDNEIQVMNIDDMTVWDSKSNVFEIKPDLLFSKSTYEYTDAYCWYCGDVRTHKYIRRNYGFPDKYIKTIYICTTCKSHFRK